MLQQALANSMVETQRIAQVTVPEAAVFRPSVEEWGMGSLAYIERIRPQAERYGICKIIPPAGWSPPCCVDLASQRPFRTRVQNIHRLQQGTGFDYKARSAVEYQRQAREFCDAWKAKHYGADAANGRERRAFSYASLEEDYWRIVETGAEEVTVEYGNDLDTKEFWSGFPRSREPTTPQAGADFGKDQYYAQTDWNTNNMPRADGCVLRYIKADINGVNVPWLYFGMMFSTFCWHNEDNYMYSVNYHHWGEPKQWYGVPGDQAEAFESTLRQFLKERFDHEPDLLHHMTTQLSPNLLMRSGVPVYKLRQEAGEFVVTFPKAFHGGFSYGLNIGEAVNFATPSWLLYGKEAALRYRRFARPSVLSHDRVLLLLSYHLEDLDLQTARDLVGELQRLRDEERSLRPALFAKGVQDLSNKLTLPPNRLDFLDSASADYDDKRMCSLCRHVRFLSGVACSCSNTRVACLHHEHLLCACQKPNKFMLCWATIQELESIIGRVQMYIRKISNPNLDIKLPRMEALKPIGSSPGRADGMPSRKRPAPVKAESERARDDYCPPCDVVEQKSMSPSPAAAAPDAKAPDVSAPNAPAGAVPAGANAEGIVPVAER